MRIALRWIVRVSLVGASVLALPAVSFAQVKVIISGGFAAAYQELLPEFERTTGIKVATASGSSLGTGPNSISGQLRSGVVADVVILSREGFSELVADSRIIKGSETDLAQSPLGIAVRSGSPKPDVSSMESLKQTLLRARSIAITAGASGNYLTGTLFRRLGIADELAKKTLVAGAAAVANGSAEVAIRPASELLPVPGVDFAGSIPAEAQMFSVYAAAIVAGSRETQAAHRLIAFLASEGAVGTIRKYGMEPLPKR